MLQMLLIDADENRAERLRAAFSPDFFVALVPDPTRGKILLEETGFDAVLLCGDAAAEAPTLVGRGMQILTLGAKGEMPPEVYAIPAEIPSEIALVARHVAVTKAMMANLNRERAVLRKKLEDMKLLNRAKATLCRTLGFTEERAHKYLEQQAMSLRITKTEAARRVLSTYEN